MRKTPQQNGVVQRMDMTLTKKERFLWLNVGLSKGFSAAILNMTCYLLNISPRASLDGKIAEEVWIGNPLV